ncbi:MAG: RNA 2'-phosphotransferase [Candidatus Nitrosocosmicus sp.]
MIKINTNTISKKLSYILRHNPNRFKVTLDEEGWADIDDLLDALRDFKDLMDLKKEDLLDIISNQKKVRFEIKENQIRAIYGHTISIKKKNPIMPPEILYHGTSHKYMNSIMRNGLIKMDRQYVHLSIDLDTAIETGKRRDGNPAIIKVDSKTAFNDGTLFYRGSDIVWLSENLLPKYLMIMMDKHIKSLSQNYLSIYDYATRELYQSKIVLDLLFISCE